MEVALSPKFLRLFKKLDPALKQETREKIKLFQDDHKNPILKTHSLKGRLQGLHSFSVNYKIRIVFTYENKDSAIFLAIGSHDIYK
ncbi:MAG: type II toxin-antitoxin system mRNA interferase toxin, RelE/StbE family [Candidatus Paceibacterota bacterium]